MATVLSRPVISSLSSPGEEADLEEARCPGEDEDEEGSPEVEVAREAESQSTQEAEGGEAEAGPYQELGEVRRAARRRARIGEGSGAERRRGDRRRADRGQLVVAREGAGDLRRAVL